jgi:hypothetical protein
MPIEDIELGLHFKSAATPSNPGERGSRKLNPVPRGHQLQSCAGFPRPIVPHETRPVIVMSQAQDVVQFMGEHGQQIDSPQNFRIAGLEFGIVRRSGINKPAIASGVAIQTDRAAGGPKTSAKVSVNGMADATRLKTTCVPFVRVLFLPLRLAAPTAR